MIIEIEDKLISEELGDVHFVCNFNACKGACCVEGDNGAPLEKEELKIMEEIFPKIKEYLLPKGIEAIAEQGKYTYNTKDKTYNTTLIDQKACAYINYENGIAGCAIEKAYNDKKIDFKKPISCHLYPIRVTALDEEMEALNYEEWDICKAACHQGNKLKVPVYQFLKEPLIRKYGEQFYATLAYAFRKNNEEKE